MNSGVSFTISRGQTVRFVGSCCGACTYPLIANNITEKERWGARAQSPSVAVVAASLKHWENERMRLSLTLLFCERFSCNFQFFFSMLVPSSVRFLYTWAGEFRRVAFPNRVDDTILIHFLSFFFCIFLLLFFLVVVVSPLSLLLPIITTTNPEEANW